MIHIHPTAPLAERVLLPGDPGRALRLAQLLLVEPKMFNHNRGLWGYTGAAHDGAALTIQSTGMGGPSCAIVVHELVALGARRLVRVGTCGAFARTPQLGGILLVTEALAADGTSRALGARDRVRPSPALRDALERAAGVGAAAGPVVTTDVFYDERGLEAEWGAAGALAVEMESAVLFRLAERLDVEAASLLVVSDLLGDGRARIEPDALEQAEAAMGRIAAQALAIEDHHSPST